MAKNDSTGHPSKPHVGYLPCKIEPGMFKGEFLVYLNGFDPVRPEEPIKAQMLVDKNEVEGIKGEPKRNSPATGWVRVTIARKVGGGMAEVVLPQPAQPVGEILLVAADELQPRAGT
jgi:hypothetical protein